MRVAMLVRRFDPAGGGTERDFAAAADCLSRAGYEVRIYAARAGAAWWHGMPVRRLPVPLLPRSLEVLGFGLLADRFARRDGAAATISFGRTADSDLIRCEGGAHAAYLEAARQWDSAAASAARVLSPYHRAQSRMEARGFRAPRLRTVLAISRLVAEDLERRFALPRGKVQTLYNGVDHKRLNDATGSRLGEDVRRALGIDRASRVVLFIGNGFARKGLGKLIEAWPLGAKEAHLIVAGEDRAADKYRDMARRLRVERRVLFLGKLNDVASLLAAADAVALPSLFEAFGNVVLEGMAAGLPVLTSARCGAAEVLPAQLRPFVVQDPMDPGEIAECLDALLAAPRELGAIAREAASQFTWERYGDRLVERVKALADPGSASSG
jgi:UDP-glucose:(heptosyl)LPS alpha-1,3-glucosyltransferase